jgi:GAF domain-containing protein
VCSSDLAGSGPLGEALEQRWPTQLNLRGPGATGREPWMPEGTAALVVPCVAANTVVGALVVFDPDAEHLFAPETVSLYTTQAAQIAAPLALARLGGVGVAL